MRLDLVTAYRWLRSPNGANSNLPTKPHKPRSSSTGFSGPVMPSAASSAGKTPVRGAVPAPAPLPHRGLPARLGLERRVRGEGERYRIRHPRAGQPQHLCRTRRAAYGGVEDVIHALVAHSGRLQEGGGGL